MRLTPYKKENKKLKNFAKTLDKFNKVCYNIGTKVEKTKK